MTVLAEYHGEEIILYFDIASDGLDAQTFGNALISFDQLYRAINEVLNPGLEIEVEFIRSDQGSIRAVLKSVKKDAQTLLHSPLLYAIFPFLLAILANMVTSSDVKIIINDNSYIVEHGTEKIILPRNAEEKAKRVHHDPAVKRSLREFFTNVGADPNVKAVDFRSPSAPNEPTIPIDREEFGVLSELSYPTEVELPKNREQPYSRQTVIVITAVLEKTKRKWQFLWNGHKIWADSLQHAEDLLVRVVSFNAILFPDEKATKQWIGGYYISNIEYRFSHLHETFNEVLKLELLKEFAGNWDPTAFPQAPRDCPKFFDEALGTLEAIVARLLKLVTT